MREQQITKAINIIKQLSKHTGYEAAFIFGSVARNEISENSDLDIQVITIDDNPAIDILHPVIEEVKLDLSFLSYDQLLKRTKEEENKRPQRVTMIGESLILFDKNGRLTKLREYYKEKQPIKLGEKSYPMQRFLIFHANDKAERNLKEDPETALLAMNFGIKELLQIHYGIHGHWWLSDKRLLEDLESWDPSLVSDIKNFIRENEPLKKFEIWSKIIDHILEPIGGRRSISENENISDISNQGLRDLLAVNE